MDPGIRELLRLVSMLVSVPVALYAGWPFYAGALQALRARSISMDVPVSIGIVLAFAASVWNAMRGHGEVYFDSVTMFVFFLALGRYVEMIARHRAGSVADALARLAPVTARRARDGVVEDVQAMELAVGDELLVRTGEVFAADGTVTEGAGRVDESMLTGESTAIAKEPGSRVHAGTQNLGAPLSVRVEAVADKTVLSGIVALLERAQAERPRLARAADRAAAWFLGRILIGAAAGVRGLVVRRSVARVLGDAGRAGRHLPLRAVARDTRRDRRRHLGARAPRRAGGALRCARDAGQGEPRAVGQDGHADEGTDTRRGSAPALGRCRSPNACRSRSRSSACRSTRSRARSWLRARASAAARDVAGRGRPGPRGYRRRAAPAHRSSCLRRGPRSVAGSAGRVRRRELGLSRRCARSARGIPAHRPAASRGRRVRRTPARAWPRLGDRERRRRRGRRPHRRAQPHRAARVTVEPGSEARTR